MNGYKNEIEETKLNFDVATALYFLFFLNIVRWKYHKNLLYFCSVSEIGLKNLSDCIYYTYHWYNTLCEYIM